MALVKLANAWFAPTEDRTRNKIQSTSGRKFERGVQEIPNVLLPYLPKTAVLVDENHNPIEVDEDTPTEEIRVDKTDDKKKPATPPRRRTASPKK